MFIPKCAYVDESTRTRQRKTSQTAFVCGVFGRKQDKFKGRWYVPIPLKLYRLNRLIDLILNICRALDYGDFTGNKTFRNVFINLKLKSDAYFFMK